MRSAAVLLRRNCPVNSTDFVCRLASVLHLLYVLAAILGVILAVVVAVAILIYRKRSADRGTVL